MAKRTKKQATPHPFKQPVEWNTPSAEQQSEWYVFIDAIQPVLQLTEKDCAEMQCWIKDSYPKPSFRITRRLTQHREVYERILLKHLTDFVALVFIRLQNTYD